ncbi:MAG TPA: hypothetical protein VFT82_03785 [Candidatus Paceibacterota bacterium]|nr:hypothetical protein [Candidatus Paceibacterota bacterium]
MDHLKDIFKGLFEHFGWFIWTLVGIAILWFFTGGTERQTAHEGAYLKPLAPLDSGQAYGTYYAGTPTSPKETLNIPESPADTVRKAENVIESFFTRSKKAEQIHANSLLANSISFDGIAGAKAVNPEAEYLRIVASTDAAKPILLSGLTLTGELLPEGISIPKAVTRPLSGEPLVASNVYLPPGGRALITTGVSPLGSSFETNICSGYLAQFKTYVPDLRRDCPLPEDELKAAGLSGDAACDDIVREMPACTIYRGTLSSNISQSCRTFITERLTYNGCVENHQNDKGFYSNEWRIFLGQSSELWKNSGEIIKLIDQKGNTVDALTY